MFISQDVSGSNELPQGSYYQTLGRTSPEIFNLFTRPPVYQTVNNFTYLYIS